MVLLITAPPAPACGCFRPPAYYLSAPLRYPTSFSAIFYNSRVKPFTSETWRCLIWFSRRIRTNDDTSYYSCGRTRQALSPRPARRARPLARFAHPLRAFAILRVPSLPRRVVLGSQRRLPGSPRRRCPRPHRPQRRRQDHALENPFAHHPADSMLHSFVSLVLSTLIGLCRSDFPTHVSSNSFPPFNSFTSNRFRTLLRMALAQPFSFQSFPHSFQRHEDGRVPPFPATPNPSNCAVPCPERERGVRPTSARRTHELRIFSQQL